MQQEKANEKTYTISLATSFFGVSKRVLPEGVPPIVGAPLVPPEQPAHRSSFGWITGACAAPNKGDHYVVEFLGERKFRILAYIDRFGRAFSTDEALVAPPARKPDLEFARFLDQSDSSYCGGCVEVYDESGEVRDVAQYAYARDRYTLFDSWFTFGPYGADLSYDDALARAYLAFVYRPSQGGAEVPERGLRFVHDCIREAELLPGLRALVDKVQSTESDLVVSPPALVISLVQGLVEAGLSALKVPDSELRLVRTARYANIYFISQDGEEAAIPNPVVWALESALNRFLLIEQAFGEKATQASEADCGRWDAYLIETVAAQAPFFERSPGTPQGVVGGEWETRCGVSVALERMKLPFRVEMDMRLSVEEGVAAFELTVPPGSLMPVRRWSDAPGSVGWQVVSAAEQQEQAIRYAMHLGLALAAALFASEPSMRRIEVLAQPLSGVGSSSDDGAPPLSEGEFPVEVSAYYHVVFTRQSFESTEAFRAAREGDPRSFFEGLGALFAVTGVDAFAAVDALAGVAWRKELPELAEIEFSETARNILGVDNSRDLRISADAQRRAIAESLADCIVKTQSATEAVRAVREEQEKADLRGDIQSFAACTRLMAALAQDAVDTEDQNAIVSCFLGEDRCFSASARVPALAEKNLDEAVKVLTDAIAESETLDGFSDGDTTLYRSFDSYAARVLYERARRSASQGQPDNARVLDLASITARVPTLDLRAAADAGKRVQLVPPSFYLSHLEVVNLLEHSFERVEEALYYGRRAIELAPATAGGYRMLGRAYMLVGDMESAIAVLESCLRVAMQPADIAIAYYQLAYVLWKAGKPREGAACYLKSVMTSSAMAVQSVVELKELIAEHGIDAIEREEVDDLLAAAGIVLAPTPEVLDALNAGAAAATDAQVFPVAHSMLSLRLRYRPDDALVNVLRSLDVSSP